MLAEFVQSLVRLGQDTKEAKVIKLPGDTYYALQRPGGEVEIRLNPRPPVAMTVQDINSFVKLMRSYCDACDHPNGTAPIITVSVDHTSLGVVISGYPDGLVRENRVTCLIDATPELQAMDTLEDGVTVPEFIKLVRRDLFEAVPSSLLNQIRAIDFAETSRTSMVVQNSGRESLGRSVELRATAGGEAIPDSVPVSFPAIRIDVPVPELSDVEALAIVQVDTKQQRVSLVLPKDGLKSALQAAAKAVANELQTIFNRLSEENAISIAEGHEIQVVVGGE